jgi:hypothetical protein
MMAVGDPDATGKQKFFEETPHGGVVTPSSPPFRLNLT